MTRTGATHASPLRSPAHVNGGTTSVKRSCHQASSRDLLLSRALMRRAAGFVAWWPMGHSGCMLAPGIGGFAGGSPSEVQDRILWCLRVRTRSAPCERQVLPNRRRRDRARQELGRRVRDHPRRRSPLFEEGDRPLSGAGRSGVDRGPRLKTGIGTGAGRHPCIRVGHSDRGRPLPPCPAALSRRAASIASTTRSIPSGSMPMSARRDRPMIRSSRTV